MAVHAPAFTPAELGRMTRPETVYVYRRVERELKARFDTDLSLAKIASGGFKRV